MCIHVLKCMNACKLYVSPVPDLSSMVVKVIMYTVPSYDQASLFSGHLHILLHAYYACLNLMSCMQLEGSGTRSVSGLTHA